MRWNILKTIWMMVNFFGGTGHCLMQVWTFIGFHRISFRISLCKWWLNWCLTCIRTVSEVVLPKRMHKTKEKKNKSEEHNKTTKPMQLENKDSTKESERKNKNNANWLPMLILKDTLGTSAEQMKNRETMQFWVRNWVFGRVWTCFF